MLQHFFSSFSNLFRNFLKLSSHPTPNSLPTQPLQAFLLHFRRLLRHISDFFHPSIFFFSFHPWFSSFFSFLIFFIFFSGWGHGRYTSDRERETRVGSDCSIQGSIHWLGGECDWRQTLHIKGSVTQWYLATSSFTLVMPLRRLLLNLLFWCFYRWIFCFGGLRRFAVCFVIQGIQHKFHPSIYFVDITILGGSSTPLKTCSVNAFTFLNPSDFAYFNIQSVSIHLYWSKLRTHVMFHWIPKNKDPITLVSSSNCAYFLSYFASSFFPFIFLNISSPISFAVSYRGHHRSRICYHRRLESWSSESTHIHSQRRHAGSNPDTLTMICKYILWHVLFVTSNFVLYEEECVIKWYLFSFH